MSINLDREPLLTLGKAAKYLPRRRGSGVHPSTLWRWCRRGVDVGGRRVYLEAVRTPSGTATTVAALQRFFDQLAGEPAGTTAPATAPEVIRKAINELNSDGI